MSHDAERTEPEPPAAEEYTHYDGTERPEEDPEAAREAALQPGKEKPGETDEGRGVEGEEDEPAD
jgi:hypothetical protein